MALSLLSWDFQKFSQTGQSVNSEELTQSQIVINSIIK